MKKEMTTIRHKNIFFIFKKCILYCMPFFLWFYSFSGFYSLKSGLKILADASRAFTYTNYFFNNLLRGVYPMWNPYNVWGRPDDFSVRIIGEFNPFLYIIPALTSLGAPFSFAYFLYLILYFFLGVIGFYWLTREIFFDKVIAYMAMVLLLFSSLGANIFNDLLCILIFVPSIWFFYFLIAFSKRGTTLSFVGLTFCSMILLITYIPFIFLTIFSIFLFCVCFIYYRILPTLLRKYVWFIQKNKILVFICILSIGISAMPGFLYSQAARGGGVCFFLA